MNLEMIANRLGNARRTSDGWSCLCPAHDDHNPSLSLTVKNGRLLVHCHAGCAQENVIAALRSRGLWPTRENVMGERRTTIDEDEDERDAEEKKFRHVRSIWRALGCASEKPTKYLKGRGIEIAPPCAMLLTAVVQLTAEAQRRAGRRGSRP